MAGPPRAPEVEEDVEEDDGGRHAHVGNARRCDPGARRTGRLLRDRFGRRDGPGGEGRSPTVAARVDDENDDRAPRHGARAGWDAQARRARARLGVGEPDRRLAGLPPGRGGLLTRPDARGDHDRLGQRRGSGGRGARGGIDGCLRRAHERSGQGSRPDRHRLPERPRAASHARADGRPDERARPRGRGA